MERTNEGQHGRANQRDAFRKRTGEKPGYQNRLEYHVPVYKQVLSARGLHRYSPATLYSNFSIDKPNPSQPSLTVFYSFIINFHHNWS
ncbi:unnamed protein product [Hymenolepis diminuta]|uniref:Uncharacterized protein n=1 Tax=Hymenolepis diminuta TaxID=6216 RepID=A0A564Y517_HYMDI|nr:unnamed protein product [Hymenolepis diminuta]